MCGRYVLSSTASSISKEFGLEQTLFSIQPSYNIAPSQPVIVIANEGVKKVIQCRWGLIPSWAKDPSIGHKMINARSETVAEKPSFREAFKKHRCLIPSDGFFEWRKEKGGKVPLFIHLKNGKPFGFAGLYSVWTSPEGDQLSTCTILTTTANKLLEPIHDRMPVIIPKEKREVWLDPAQHDRDILLPLLKPFPSEEMEAYDVTSRVNSPRNDAPDNIEPV
jgi:putative SOS response-associated peptidase YedK